MNQGRVADGGGFANFFFLCDLSVNQSRDAMGAKRVGGEESMGFSLPSLDIRARGEGGQGSASRER